MLKQILSIYLISLTLISEGRFLKRIQDENGVIKAYAYKETNALDQNSQILCELQYTPSYKTVGWDTLEVQTNPADQTDAEQAQCAGELEGFVTLNATYINFYNNVKGWCEGREQTCVKVYDFLDKHLKWIEQSIKDHADHDPIWHQVEVFYNHLVGLHTGYMEGQTDPKKNLTISDFLLMNLQNDLADVASALEGDVSAKLRGETHCSAIVKLLPGNEDLLVGHNTWTSYVQMYRMLKKYDMPLRKTGLSKKMVPGQQISFSGYPGVITSGDDFYVTSAGLVVLETTIGNSNASRWQYVQPTGQLFDTVRSLTALRLAKDGRNWCKTFSPYNSGTYNNQWIIVDLKKFKPRKPLGKGTLWILEQIPGYIRSEDKTATLTEQLYWPSYNVPYYPDVFNLSGNQELVDLYGDWFSYNNTPRALIFKRDHSTVTDLDSLLSLLRSNNYKNDPYSKCNCTPPYSAENAIASRNDLNPKNGTYPFPALGHRHHGAIDAKVVSPLLAHNLTFTAINGPTTGNQLPPFRWSKSDFKHLPHKGQPDTFVHFQPFNVSWQGPFF